MILEVVLGKKYDSDIFVRLACPAHGRKWYERVPNAQVWCPVLRLITYGCRLGINRTLTENYYKSDFSIYGLASKVKTLTQETRFERRRDPLKGWEY